MSRSYRHQPFASVTGNCSAKEDKKLAHRGVRHVQNHIARMMATNPDLEMPHFRSCPRNEVYNWSRDGSQRWQVPDARCWSDHCMAVQRIGIDSYPHFWKSNLDWPPKWYIELMRK